MKNKTLDDVIKEIENGVNFPGKGSIDPLDRLDFLKREVCAYFVGQLKGGELESDIIAKAKFTSIVEYRAAIKFRTERLTLERLIECYDEYTQSNSMSRIKESLISDIHRIGFSGIKMTGKIKMLIEAKTIEPLYLDYLVVLLEKCQVNAGITEEEKNKSILFKKIL